MTINIFQRVFFFVFISSLPRSNFIPRKITTEEFGFSKLPGLQPTSENRTLIVIFFSKCRVANLKLYGTFL